MDKSKFRKLIQEVVALLNLESLDPNPDDSITLRFDGKLELNLSMHTRDRILVRAVVGRLPEDESDQQELLRRLLTLNLSRLRIQEEVLSVEEGTKELVLFEYISGDVFARDLVMKLETFLNRTEFWSVEAGGTKHSSIPMGMFQF